MIDRRADVTTLAEEGLRVLGWSLVFTDPDPGRRFRCVRGLIGNAWREEPEPVVLLAAILASRRDGTPCPACRGHCTNGAQCAMSQMLTEPADWRHGVPEAVRWPVRDR